ncbi:MAG: ABC transporter permease [Xanthobacteraceae bacterium]|jgi:putative spermidine/putrescine transport system permease protein
MMRWRIAEDYAAAVIFRLLLAAIIFFLIVPIGVAVILSFDDREFIGTFPPTRFSLRWYRAFMQNPSYLDGLVVSLKLALVATMISIVAGAGAAIALTESQWRGRDVVETLFLSPKFVPTVVIGFSILGFASAIHVFDAFTRLVMGHVVITIPFTVRATLASLVGIPRSLGEAAVSLGATPWRAFVDITLPLARTGIIAGGLMAFVLSFDEVAVSIFLTDAFTQTLPIALVAEMRANLNLTVAAISTVLATLAVIIVLILDRAAGLDNVIGRGMYRG